MEKYLSELIKILVKNKDHSIIWAKYFALVQSILSDQTISQPQINKLQTDMSIIFIKYTFLKSSFFSKRSNSSQYIALLENLNTQISSGKYLRTDPIIEFTFNFIAKIVYSLIMAKKWDEATEIITKIFNIPEVKNRIPDIVIHPLAITSKENIALKKSIEFMNLLEPGALYMSSSLYPLSNYIEKFDGAESESEKKGTAALIKKIQEIQAIIYLAQAWSIHGSSTVLGGTIIFESSTNSLLFESLRHNLKSIMDNQQDYESLIDRVFMKIPAISKDKISKIIIDSIKNLNLTITEEDKDGFSYNPTSKTHFKQGAIQLTLEAIYLPNTRYHSVAIGIFTEKKNQNILCFINRGYQIKAIDKQLGAGIKIYRINDKVKSEILELTPDLYSAQVLNRIFDAKTPLQPIDYIKMKGQTVGNCASVAAKDIVWCAVYLNALKNINEKDFPHTDNFEKLRGDIAKVIATAAYKWYSEYLRINLINEYLSIDNGFTKDKTLLAAIYNKARQETWQNRGMEAVISALGDIPDVKNIADELQVKNIVAAIEQADVRLMEKIMYNFENQQILTETPLLYLSIKKVVSEISSEESTFNESLQILKLLADNNVQLLDGGRKFYSPADLLSTLIDGKYHADNPRVAQISTILEALDSPKPGHLNFQILMGDFERVQKIARTMQPPITKDELSNKLPLELAIQSLAIAANTPSDNFDNRIQIVEFLIQVGINELPENVSARSIFDDGLKLGSADKDASSTAAATEPDPTKLERAYAVLDTLTVAENVRSSRRLTQ